MDAWWLAPAGLGLTAAALAARQARSRALGRWLPTYALSPHWRRAPEGGRPVHLLLCLADHFEPKLGGATPRQAQRRVRRWTEGFPRLAAGFRDSDGRPPRHTFFYPVEEYEPEFIDALADLCRAGYGEVEVHLHHDDDTADNLRATLADFRDQLADRHGLLARDRATGALAYGFIHGNWALDNSRPDGRYCGVNNELDILRETGCYADFTLPSAPSPTQTRKINSIYYAVDDPRRPKSHDRGVAAGTAPRPAGGLLMVQGPLLLDWGRRKWGLVPRIENGCVQRSQPPSAERIDLWLRARVQVPTRPDWFFVKLHTHGANEENEAALLGEPMARFHRALARRAADDPQFHFHYVTARELFNLARAAEAGWTGAVRDALNFELQWNGDPSALRIGGVMAGASA